MAPEDVQAPSSPHPSLARRLAAMAYESLIVAAILLVASFAFLGATTSRLEGLARHLFQGYLFLVLGLYFVWCWRRGGQTLPMKAWKLRVVRRNGAPLDTPRALLRYVLAASALGASAVAAAVLWREPATWLAWLALAPGVLTVLWSRVDAERQFLHDRLAGTKIVTSDG
ncbi:MAG: RDD family protein [Burkholderiales bacterium]